ncbi:hypothetical protein OQJ26_00090 [Legionella sp. PATHC038]|uniref:hypothetical protein n=1 Tax=Legionella sheltonii TaxID=2992041 RepID=UPI002244250E|nr:hypothetical protein [Legionella sp. PATHC038]MCW8397192.1 hypothetical protein [Legionella sp. PATHC038]
MALTKIQKKKISNFFSAVGYAPATAFNFITNLILGSTETDKDTGQSVKKPGLIGLLADGIKSLVGLLADGLKTVTRAAADFLVAHKKAIAVAAWTSLAVAGAAALTLFLWPAALTAVASFSVYGISIAGIAGANALAQIGVASALSFAATSTLAYVGAAAGNFVKWVAGCCKKASASRKPLVIHTANEDEQDDLLVTTVPSPLGNLGSSKVERKEQKEADVLNFKPLLSSKPTVTAKKSEEDLLSLDEEAAHTPARKLSGSQQ